MYGKSSFIVTLGSALILAGVWPSALVAQETFFDPENPAFDTLPTIEDEDEDEVPALRPSTWQQSQGQAFSSASFIARYSSALAVDTSFDKGGEDIVEAATELYMQLDYDLSLQTRIFVSGRFTHWIGGKENPDQFNALVNASEVRTHYEALLDEAYVRHRPGNWTLTLGNLRTPWGSTDLARPGDVINAGDLSSGAGLAGGGGALVPQLTAMASYSGSRGSVTALLVPFFVPNRVSVFGRDSSVANPSNALVAEQMPVLLLLEQLIDPSRHDDFQPVLTATRRPHDTPRGASLGLRGTTTVANTDLGLGIFYGWDRTPWMYMDEDMKELLGLMVNDAQVLEDFDFLEFIRRNPQALSISNRLSAKAGEGEELFYSEYRRRATLVVDAARYLGPIGVRADLAFSPSRTFFTSELQPERRASLFGALGLSYEILDEDAPLAVIVEGFALYPFARNSAINQAFVPAADRAEDADLAIIGDGYYGVATGLMWGTPLWDLDLQLGGLYSVSGGDWLGTASLTKPWKSWLHTRVGLVYFDGPDPARELTLGGLYRTNDQVFFALEGTF